MYNVYIFDCDGVILDSNGIKSKAFDEILEEAELTKEQQKEALEYHKLNGGVPRIEKFEQIFKKFIPPAIREEQITLKDLVEILDISYANKISKQIKECDKVKGIDNMLLSLPKNSYSYVISGAKQSELREALKAHNLTDHFNGIYGAFAYEPSSKPYWLGKILDWITLPREDVKGVFFGDAKLDYETAAEYGFDFVFISEYTEFEDWEDFFKDKDVIIAKDFDDYMEGLKD